MANPQKENGHVPIANEIIEAMARTEFNPCEIRVLMVVFRKTFGWNKSFDCISLSQFQMLTGGLERRSITRTLAALEARKIIEVLRDHGGHINAYRIQKDYEQWLKRVGTTMTLPSRDTHDPTGRDKSVLEVGTTPCGVRGDTHDPHNRHKDNITKDSEILLAAPPEKPKTKNESPGLTTPDLKQIQDQIKDLENIGYEPQEIKKFLMGKKIPEALIDEAMGKKF